ncbi:MAG: RNase P subunit p30 family protein, partial [Candidatus Aenigmatarchaeota archaeon]
LVRGGDADLNRAAVETPEVDILAHPWRERKDCGLDHVMAKLAAKNRVAVQFDFSELLHSSKRSRVQLLAQLMAAAELVRKYRAPFIISSGARAPFDLRAPSDLVSFGRVLGFRDPDIKRALSGGIVKENRKRLSGKWVMPGVEIE